MSFNVSPIKFVTMTRLDLHTFFSPPPDIWVIMTVWRIWKIIITVLYCAQLCTTVVHNICTHIWSVGFRFTPWWRLWLNSNNLLNIVHILQYDNICGSDAGIKLVSAIITSQPSQTIGMIYCSLPSQSNIKQFNVLNYGETNQHSQTFK